MTISSDQLALFARTRRRFQAALVGRLPAGQASEALLSAYAYYVCTAVRKRRADWQQVLDEYMALALQRAEADMAAYQQETALLRRELALARGPLLDVGAGWGRLSGLYGALHLWAICVEPSWLGAQLMGQRGLNGVVCGRGEALPFADALFLTTVIGWVLHHDGSDVRADALLAEVSRVTRPGGRLLSLEPLDQRFTLPEWQQLLEAAGFAVRSIDRFHEMSASQGQTKVHTLIVATRTQ